MIEVLIERYRNDVVFNRLVDLCLHCYHNTGMFPRRMITGNAFNDIVDGGMFADAVKLADYLVSDNPYTP